MSTTTGAGQDAPDFGVSGRTGTAPLAIVLVEGESDRVALETLAARRGHDLAADGVFITAIGGAHAIGSVLRRAGGRWRDGGIRLAGLCDASEEVEFARALERAGRGSDVDRGALEKLGFYVCDPDLEGELIRALGAEAVEDVLARSGKLSSFRTFQKQPQWRGRATESQLRRFFGSSAGKIEYARLLVEALDLEFVPRPLDRVLDHVSGDAQPRATE